MNTAPVSRTLNPRAVLILTVAVLVFGVGVHFVHGYQVKRNARDLLEQARQMEQEGHLDQAADMLGQYLGMMPSDNDALARYGLLLDRLAKNGRAKLHALLVLNHALNRDSEQVEVRRQAARIALEVGWFKDAKVHLETLLKESTPDAELLRLLARSEVGARQFDKAAEKYAHAVQMTPKDEKLCQEYAELLRERLDRPDVANSVMEGLVAKDGRAAPARLAAARYYLRYGMADKAEMHTKFLLTELAAEDAEVLLLAAEVAQAQGKLEAARTHLERGVQRHPNDASLSYQMARLEIRSGERQKAAQLLEPRFQSLPTKPEELENLAGLLLDAGEKERALTVIKQLREAGAAPAADYLEARVLMQQSDYGKARPLLEKASKYSPRTPERRRRAELLLAECHRQLGSPDERLRACRQALESDRHWLPARRDLADTLVSIGKLDEAIHEYRQLVAQLPEVRTTLGGLLIVSNLRAPAAMRNWNEVQTIVQELANDKQRANEAKLLEARILAAQNKLRETRTVLEAERARDPKQITPWLLLASLAEREGSKTAILPLLDKAERQVGKRVEWELARMRYWASSGQAQAQLELAKIETRLAQYPEADQDQLRDGLARAYGMAGAPEAAERLWRQLAQHQPRNLAVRFWLFERAIETDKEKEAERLLGEIRNLEGGRRAYTVYGEAAQHFLRVRHGEKEALAEARRCLREAAGLRPTWPRVPLLEANLDELEKRPDKALPHYQAALTLGENGLSIVRRVLELLSQQGRYAEANALLHRLPKATLDLPDVGHLAAALTLETEGKEAGEGGQHARAEALRLARKAVADSKDHRDYLWLGQVATMAGQPKEAEQALRRARDLAEVVPETWTALILFLARTDAKRAEAELTEAKRKLPPDKAPLALAACQEALGRRKEAEQSYQTALAGKLNDPDILRNAAGFYGRTGQRAKAEPLLRRLLAAETGAPEEMAAWARRSLALNLADTGSPQDFRQALALLQENSKDDQEAWEDLAARAAVLATRPGRRKEALRLLESVPPRRLATAPDLQLMMAHLYERTSNWPKAQRQMLALLSSADTNPAYLAQYVRALLRHDQAEEAGEWVDRLAKLGEEAFETYELRVRVLRARNKPEQAAHAARAYARKKGAQLDLAAALLEVAGQPTEAEQLYRAYAAASPGTQSAVLLAKHLARQGRTSEALDLCEQVWQKSPPEAVANACLAILGGNSTERDKQRVEQWLRTAMRKHPEVTNLPALLALLQENRGRKEEAVELYRQFIRQGGSSAVALNNLAHLLVLKGEANDEALRSINEAIDLAGPMPAFLDTRAAVYLKGKQPTLAIKDLEQAVREEERPLYLFHLAQAYQATANSSAARKFLAKAQARGLKAVDVPPEEFAVLESLTAQLGLK